MTVVNEQLGLLAMHAHPDDEAIGTGGVLARYSAEGLRVALVTATRGEVGEIVDPGIDSESARADLGAIREDELRAACAVLGVSEVFFLGYRDSGMAGTPDNQNPDAFCQADLAAATGRLVQLVRRLRPNVLVSYDEHGGYGHPDHMMAHRVTLAAFEAAGDPQRYPELGLAPWQPQKLYETAIPRSWIGELRDHFRRAGLRSPFERRDFDATRFGTPDEVITTRVDVRDYFDPKLRAIACHRTQIGADSFFFRLPPEILREGMSREHFVRVRSLVAAPAAEDDLFAGLR